MKRLSVIVYAMLVCACANTKIYSSYISEKIKAQPLHNREWLSVTFHQETPGVSKSESTKSSVIPALLYWRIRNDYRNQIDEYSAMTVLAKHIFAAADSLKLRESLGTSAVSIEITQLPHEFMYSVRKHSIILLLGAAGWETEIVTPSHSDLVATVTMTNQGNSSSFPITIKNEEQNARKVSIVTRRYGALLEKYLADYEKELERMGTELVMEISRKKR